MKANILEEGVRKDKKSVRSMRKSASDLSLTGPPSIGGWLECLGLKQYESHFIREGFNDIESVRFACSITYFIHNCLLILAKILISHLIALSILSLWISSSCTFDFLIFCLSFL